jgi:hypothetical protein
MKLITNPLPNNNQQHSKSEIVGQGTATMVVASNLPWKTVKGIGNAC